MAACRPLQDVAKLVYLEATTSSEKIGITWLVNGYRFHLFADTQSIVYFSCAHGRMCSNEAFSSGMKT